MDRKIETLAYGIWKSCPIVCMSACMYVCMYVSVTFLKFWFKLSYSLFFFLQTRLKLHIHTYNISTNLLHRIKQRREREIRRRREKKIRDKDTNKVLKYITFLELIWLEILLCEHNDNAEGTNGNGKRKYCHDKQATWVKVYRVSEYKWVSV